MPYPTAAAPRLDAGACPPPPQAPGDLDPRALRTLLGSYPTGVAIVTTRASGGRRVGLTINSFASLSLDPPLVLWSLGNHSPSLGIFRDSRHFAIHVLARDQQALARRFADPSVRDKFEGVATHDTPEGVPLIDGALTALVCAHDRCCDAGDHLLLIGRIVGTRQCGGTPLVFHAGRYAALAPA
ncbi:Nitrilotriacetate monooxygenase component B [Castellaniella defragrans 65Phen]|uniref:Nitrilotriacetate monooxygenase component B n=1 Tax=Castellaniella defragrans (strain DSM 12143 / CCUG 39792 / 65Phen) TaxID=1437824 RepID=W8X4W3_CASD6|nr:flavin reductase family protein [Castellaniella defragrans]CDM25117.1 Nitrilotriacetate monooxygenase component B [Castellaniella defragrans 65Phen]